MFVIWLFTLTGAAFCFATVYSFAVWWQVRGLTGLMQIFLFTALAYIAFTTAWFYSPDPRVNLIWVVALQRAAWGVSALASLVLADSYAASRNSHRALTTKLYIWFQRLSEERKR